MSPQNSLFILLMVLLSNFINSSKLHANDMDDYIITLKNETIVCHIPLSPKEVFRESRKGTYFFDYVVAKFKGDSVRYFVPGSIKAYARNVIVNGKNQTDRYFSDSVITDFDAVVKGNGGKRALFVLRLIDGAPYQLWFFEDYDRADKHDTRVFILKETSTGVVHHVLRTRQLWKILGTWPGCNKRDPRYKHWYTGKQNMVLDYNKAVKI